MKHSNDFKNIIEQHLNKVAESDPLFAETLKKENKNIDDCINYILNTVQKSGCNGFADDEIFGMAIHYYDEDDIEVGKPINAKVVVNHAIAPMEISEEEKDSMRKDAIAQVYAEAKERLKKKSAPKKEAANITIPSLFD